MLLYATEPEHTPHGNPIKVGSCGGPTVPLYPAPWQLRGNGLIMITRTPLAHLQADSAIPAGIRSTLRAPLNLLMLVNYTQSDCGPYQELLYIPGTALVGSQRHPTISNIFVSSEASVVNGRLNWGIPKERCHFDWQRTDDGLIRIAAQLGNAPFFEISYESSGLRLPVNTRWAPRLLKTLGQERDGQVFVFSPSAKGHARRAKIQALNVAAGSFPVISTQHIVAAFEITDFDMEFPVPQIL